MHGRLAAAGPGAWAVGCPTLHGGPLRLRPVRATPCLTAFTAAMIAMIARIASIKLLTNRVLIYFLNDIVRFYVHLFWRE